jgi:pterin-4a-carbinolamine dehydratase
MARLSDEEIDERLRPPHSEGGLTENDFELARRIDALA